MLLRHTGILCHRGTRGEGSPRIILGLPVLLRHTGIICHRVTGRVVGPGLPVLLWRTGIDVLCHRGARGEGSPRIIPGLLELLCHARDTWYCTGHYWICVHYFSLPPTLGGGLQESPDWD